MRVREVLKSVAYKTPLVRRVALPRYRYKIAPAQLAFLCDGIDRSRDVSGCVMEVGVARGETSAFILEHMRTTGDNRPVYFLDTFSGFTEESVQHEMKARGKTGEMLDSFRYGDMAIFENGLKSLGYSGFTVVAGDAAKLDYKQFGAISVVLLDIDLYQPTIEILKKIWPLMTTPGFICVDDCAPNTSWDGALQAYSEFASQIGAPMHIVGGKGGILIKTAPNS